MQQLSTDGTKKAGQAVLLKSPDESLHADIGNKPLQTIKASGSSQLHMKPCQICLGPGSPVVQKTHPLDSQVPCCCRDPVAATLEPRRHC